MPLPVRNWRTSVRSLKARCAGAPDWLRLASKLALNTRVLSTASRRTPARTSRRERDHSANAITAKKNSVISDTTSRVSSLRLTSTRS